MQIIDCIQGTEKWAAARRGIATASCADQIITPAKADWSKSATGYACQLIAEMITPAHYWIDDDYQSRDMRTGKTTEGEARDYFELDRGVTVSEVGFVLTDDGRYGCSPDGLVGEREGLELKCPKHKTQIRYLLDGILPVEYAPQVHWSMVVTKLPVWNFMSYAVGLPPLIVRVEANEYTVKVAQLMERFWALLADMKSKIEACDPVAATRKNEPAYF